MTEPQPLTYVPDSTETVVFERVVCGVDVGRAGQIAARQAAQVVAAHGSLLLVTATVGEVVSAVAPAGLGYASGRTMIDAATRERYTGALTDAREDAVAHFPGTRMLRVEGDPLSSLLGALEGEDATLAVVGSHGTDRIPGILLGSVATHLLHKAPCSVLVARQEWPEGRPSRVIVGADGSRAAVTALHAAHDLAERLGSPLEALTDPDPVQALVAAAGKDDLIVVGSRGLHGPRALGSVSERVAHRAPCSVLVVRPTDWEVSE
jgi:nucleotide-binding universal stress UspA family protein